MELSEEENFQGQEKKVESLCRFFLFFFGFVVSKNISNIMPEVILEKSSSLSVTFEQQRTKLCRRYASEGLKI